MLFHFGPPAQEGVRLIAEPDMHVTLHFLGSIETEPVRECLRAVDMPAPSLRLDCPGHYSQRGRRRILWVGVHPADQLVALHARTGEALRAVGFEYERRSYQPHITLARLNAKASRDIVAKFENQQFGEIRRDFECEQFALFESETAADGARYRIVESFPLTARA